MRAKRGQTGTRVFTLIELLVVIAIISILASMLLPALGTAREKGRQITCTSNMKSIGTALMMYLDDSDYYLPKYSWGGDHHAALFPYMGGTGQYSSFYTNSKNWRYFACPSENRQHMIAGYGYGTDPGNYSSIAVGYSYEPTVTAYNQANYETKTIWGGVVPFVNYLSYMPKLHKRFTTVSDHSVLYFDSACTAYAVPGGSFPNYLIPKKGSGSYEHNSEPAYYDSKAGAASFYHNGNSNFLYKDGSVQSHRLGTQWNNDWQLE